MNLNGVKTEVTVDGKSCDFETLDLHQRIAGHHTFEIVVNYRTKKQSVWALTVDDIFRETLGKPVGIVMTHIESGEGTEFRGVVTDIEAVGIDGDQGTIILKGGSPTILLDRDPAMGAYVDYTLYNLVAETIENTGIEVNVENKPTLTRIIPYLARYKESRWAFLSRVLCSFGQWFYYDGTKLVVSDIWRNQKETRVTYDMELLEVRSAAGLHNLKTKYYDYDPAENNYFEEESGTISNANLLMRGAKMASDPLYPTVSKLPVGRQVLGETDMSSVVQTKQSREYVKMSVFTASCSSCAVRIGEIATVLLPETLRNVKFIDLGAFRVIEVHHHAESPNRPGQAGRYSNIFKGIAAQAETMPDDHIVIPQAFPEPATVVDNDDPRHQGRVKVRYFWQAEDAGTNWIRVQAPDAGKSDAVDGNRGMVFIPEKGDQVMVGFVQGDPGRPYVMGSLFHRDNAKGATTEKNTVRSIITRSGSLLRFTDSEDEKTFKIELQYNKTNGIILTVKEDEGTMTIQTSKDIFVKAPELIQFEAKKIVMLAKEGIQAKSEDKIEIVAQKSAHIESSDKMAVMGKSIAQEASDELSLKGKNVKVKADSSMAIDGGGKLDVKGSSLKMNQ
jgi:uncharacterized protein involved in type VI secretion and phage assembly